MTLLALPAIAAGLLVVTAAVAQEAPRSRGHALGADTASLAAPVAPAPPARGGHAFGHDLHALATPIPCGAAPCAGGTPAAADE